MDTEELKNKVIQRIDESRDRIIEIGKKIYDRAELGYKEEFATEVVSGELERLGLEVERNIARTGCHARVNREKDRPAVALMGELDAVISREHPDSLPETGAVHACGHNIQASVMLGAAMGLIESGVIDDLDGRIDLFGVPAEEFVEIEYRSNLAEKGEIRFFGGKQELIRRGYLDDIDMLLMMHSLALGHLGKKINIGAHGNGFVGKRIHFTGKEAHAGSEPQKGINALNAAMLAMNNIHVQRETFPDDEYIRVHPIITKGGDMVNIVPADVRMESYVRGRTPEGILDANKKVTKALKAGAFAVGAGLTIDDIPGYMPLLNSDGLDELFRENVLNFVSEDEIIEGGSFGGSSDIGDVSHIMPILHPFIGGVTGNIHTPAFKLEDPEIAYIVPAKAIAMTTIDLLANGAEKALDVKKNFTQKMTKEQYLEFMDSVSKTETVELEE